MRRTLVLGALVTVAAFVAADDPPATPIPPLQNSDPLPTAIPTTPTNAVPNGADRGELDTILKENPDLVPTLLSAAAESDNAEEMALVLYGLGPGITDVLIEQLTEGPPKLREVAAVGLCHVCLHEDAPRSKVVGALLAAHKNRKDADALETAELLAFVIQTTRPTFRAMMRQALEAEMSDDFGAVTPEEAMPYRVHGGVL